MLHHFTNPLRATAFLLVAVAFHGFCHAEEKEDGEAIYQRTCIACHGENGAGNPLLKSPPIAGLPEWYITLQLGRFRDGHRGSHLEDIPGLQMAAIAKILKAEDIAPLSKHVSGMQPIPTEPSDFGDREKGKVLFSENCAECHRFNATGDRAFRSPPLASFPAWYLRDQFGNFQNGQRGVD